MIFSSTLFNLVCGLLDDTVSAQECTVFNVQMICVQIGNNLEVSVV